MSIENLDTFALSLYQEIQAESQIEEEVKSPEDVFVDKIIDILNDAGEFDNAIPCPHKSRGLKVNGYDWNEDEDRLSILVSHYNNVAPPPLSKLSNTEIDTELKRAQTFLEKSIEGHYDKIDESLPSRDFAERIYSNKDTLKKVKIVLLTNEIAGKSPEDTRHEHGLEISYSIWDIERLFRLESSGIRKEPLTVDFNKEFKEPLPCVSMDDGLGIYTTYLSIIPGYILAALYDKYGTRLLERNVRSFLQARGKINKGIRDTILNEPNMFMAYNNGITATANSITLEKLQDGGMGIGEIHDFQIVNGGQTTASLAHTHKEKKTPLNNIYVQMKLTVLKDPNQIDVIAPKISRYSNTQNKVSSADFSANDPFHVSLEQIANSTWTPNLDSIWFYERSRGSYEETKNKEGTPSKIKKWESLHPRRQRFDKLMLAKVEETWALRPYMVSRGAQKNFVDYTILLREAGVISCNDEYFKNTVAKIIIWHNAERIWSAQNIPDYRAQLVSYAISWLVFLTNNTVDLPRIWVSQSIGAGLKEALDVLIYNVRDYFNAKGGNTGEWYKREECWEELKHQTIELPSLLRGELAQVSIPIKIGVESPPTAEEQQTIDWCCSLGHNVWFEISKWGAQKGADGQKFMSSAYNSIAYNIGQRIKYGGKPTKKQAIQGKKIYDKAKLLGFIEYR